MALLVNLVKSKYSPPAEPQVSFAGKTVLVTGANSGLGFEAAALFSKLGASKVILAVRTVSKGEEAKKKIESRYKGKGALEVWQMDMSSYDSIQAFSNRINNELDKLDIAVLNAGVISYKYEVSEYGWVPTIQVNTLSTVLLGLLLLPKLRSSKSATSTPVLEFVSSGTYSMATIPEDWKKSDSILAKANEEKVFNFQSLYGQSKLFLMYALRTMTKMALSPSGEPDVIVTSVCPGMAKSDLSRGVDNKIMQMMQWLLFTLLANSAEEASRRYVSGVVQGPQGHGGFWQFEKFQEDAPLLKGEEGEKLRQKVWYEIINAISKDVPSVVELAKGA